MTMCRPLTLLLETQDPRILARAYREREAFNSEIIGVTIYSNTKF